MNKRDALWLAFPVGTSVKDARKRFAEKYGVEAEEVSDGIGMILVGPVPENKIIREPTEIEAHELFPFT